MITAEATTAPASLWAYTAPETAANPPLRGDHSTDVAVIGAGFTGLRAALHLAEAGTRVIVVDAGDVGAGASGRNGGQVNPMLPFNAPSKIREIVGAKTFERLAEASLGSADALFDMIRRYQIDCQARQNGWLRVNHSNAAHRKAIADTQNWNAIGAEMEVIDGAEVRRLSGSDTYQSGMVNPRGGAVQPLMLAQGLARVARDRGARIHGGSAVKSLSRQGDSWVVATAHGRITAQSVIVATNGYSDDLVPNLAKSVIPITPVQIASDPLPEDVIAEILPHGHTISDSRRVIMYARREPDNRMVYGGHGQPDRHGNLGGFDWLVKDAERVFPQLRGVTWRHRWGGKIAITDDHLPHLHEPKPGLLVGLGYNGRGVAMANVMGRVLAERAMGAAPETLPFPITSLAPIPLRNAKVFGLPHVIRWMRFLDKIETR
ncbi:FAD-binding oxidoreductase [Gymnodinialimonas sp. 2305UL16-5]|uniref:NAD(P)/FAD-dependent oxidoreductase n=1 Tax=Gymnodinialimonas mytili TaxID=3126503 RepID=UPI0030B3E93F